MAVRSTNTFAEFLQKLLGDLSTAKLMPDADLPFIVNLETTILGKAREPFDNAAGQLQGPSGAQPMPDPSAMGPGMGAPPQGPPPMGPPSMVGQGMTGLRQEPSMPNPDELRRMLGR